MDCYCFQTVAVSATVFCTVCLLLFSDCYTDTVFRLVSVTFFQTGVVSVAVFRLVCCLLLFSDWYRSVTVFRLVYCLIVVLFVVAWPLSKVLDCLLGHDHGMFYRRGQLKVLVDLHGPSSQHSDGPGPGGGDDKVDEHLTIDEVLIIKVRLHEGAGLLLDWLNVVTTKMRNISLWLTCSLSR